MVDRLAAVLRLAVVERGGQSAIERPVIEGAVLAHAALCLTDDEETA